MEKEEESFYAPLFLFMDLFKFFNYLTMQINNNLTLNKWNDYNFNLDSQIITENLIKRSLSSLQSYIFSSSTLPVSKSLKLLILFKVKTINNQYRTISYMQTIDIKDFHLLNQLFIEYWHLKSEDYYLAEYSHIIYTYKILDVNLETKILKAEKLNKKYKIDTFKFGGFLLPSSMDFTS